MLYWKIKGLQVGAVDFSKLAIDDLHLRSETSLPVKAASTDLISNPQVNLSHKAENLA